MENINIVITSDDGYIQPASVLITSILENSKYCKEIFFYFLDSGIKEYSKKILKDICNNYGTNIKFLKIDSSIFENFYISHHIKHSSYYRIVATKYLPNHVEKFLYLDVDIVVNADIYNLFNYNLDGYILKAVKELQGYERIEELKIPNGKYFNAGVLLIDRLKWDLFSVTEKTIEFINNNPSKLKYWDQDALNAILYDSWGELSNLWNAQTNLYYEIEEKMSFKEKKNIDKQLFETYLIHYTSFAKPWHILCYHPLRKYYYDYLKLTVFKEYNPMPKKILELLNEKEEIIVFGTGTLAKHFKSLLKENNKIVAFLDNNKNSQGQKLYDIPILEPSSIVSIEGLRNKKIFVCSSYYLEIEEQLVKMGLSEGQHFVEVKYGYNELLLGDIGE
ncbi:glycosyltransferase [Lysinibacillus capsici]|uniref:glycosyltransferase n=1 Tax=Lysinibacillus capsici TaxID=2115968 RepID=UPI0034E4FA08